MTQRITDARLREIYETRFSTTLPRALVHAAYKACHHLIDAETLSDIDLMFEIRTYAGLLAVHVHGRWFILFQWHPIQRASDLSLKRLE